VILSYCNEKRIELDLFDAMGWELQQQDPKPQLAFRCRVATEGDVRFVQSWNQQLSFISTMFKGLFQTKESEWRQLASLVTEWDESAVPVARLILAMSENMVSSPRGTVRVKPFPDPERPETTMFRRIKDRDTTTVKALGRGGKWNIGEVVFGGTFVS
jgi:hypothetical protein